MAALSGAGASFARSGCEAMIFLAAAVEWRRARREVEEEEEAEEEEAGSAVFARDTALVRLRPIMVKRAADASRILVLLWELGWHLERCEQGLMVDVVRRWEPAMDRW